MGENILMKKVIGVIVCLLLITASGISVVGNIKQIDLLDKDQVSINSEKTEHLNQVDNWPMFRHDLNHSGYSTDKAPETNDTLWKLIVTVHSPPAVVDDKVYFGLKDYEKVWCVKAETGDLIWTYDSEGNTFSGGPAIADGRLYIAGESSYFYCLDIESGEREWQKFISGGSESCPAVYEGKVYFGSNGIDLYCLDAETGDEIWTFNTNSDVDSSPAVNDGKVYFGSNDDNIYCFDAETGDEIWSYHTPSNVYSSPAIYEGKIYIGSGSGSNYVYCLDAETGEEVWTSFLDHRVLASPAVVNDKVYINSQNTMYCFDAATGEEIWENSIDDFCRSSPAVADNKVYYASDELMLCLDATEGDKLWEYDLETSDARSSPAVVNNRVYFANHAFGVSSPPPQVPTLDGPTDGFVGVEYEFSSSSSDPNEDKIYYMFDWGDGSYSDWLGPYDSGQTIYATNTWDYEDLFDVRVKAKDDNYSSETAWSTPLTINIVQGPRLEIENIRGGVFKISSLIKNTGTLDAIDVNWSVTLSGGAFIGKENTGKETIPGGGEITVKSKLIIGFGATTVTVKASTPESSDTRVQSGSVFLFFIRVKPGGE